MAMVWIRKCFRDEALYRELVGHCCKVYVPKLGFRPLLTYALRGELMILHRGKIECSVCS